MSPLYWSLLALLALLFAWPFLAYPLVVRLFRARPFQPRAIPDSERPWVSVLIPACNEARHIENKLRGTLGFEYPANRLEIIVCSDGSSDDTAERVRRFEDRGVKLLINEERRGKAATLGRLVEAASGEIVMFTDASADVASHTLGRLVDHLGDPAVGVACARYVVRRTTDPHGGSEPAYWGFEARLRRDESVRDLLIGASGAGYAIRKALWPGVESDTVNDDWVIPLAIRRAGHRVAYVHDAIAADDPTAETAQLYHRWVRIA